MASGPPTGDGSRRRTGHVLSSCPWPCRRSPKTPRNGAKPPDAVPRVMSGPPGSRLFISASSLPAAGSSTVPAKLPTGCNPPAGVNPRIPDSARTRPGPRDAGPHDPVLDTEPFPASSPAGLQAGREPPGDRREKAPQSRRARQPGRDRPLRSPGPGPDNRPPSLQPGTSAARNSSESAAGGRSRPPPLPGVRFAVKMAAVTGDNAQRDPAGGHPRRDPGRRRPEHG